jgi:hypothetical protein
MIRHPLSPLLRLALSLRLSARDAIDLVIRLRGAVLPLAALDFGAGGPP